MVIVNLDVGAGVAAKETTSPGVTPVPSRDSGGFDAHLQRATQRPAEKEVRRQEKTSNQEAAAGTTASTDGTKVQPSPQPAEATGSVEEGTTEEATEGAVAVDEEVSTEEEQAAVADQAATAMAATIVAAKPVNVEVTDPVASEDSQHSAVEGVGKNDGRKGARKGEAKNPTTPKSQLNGGPRAPVEDKPSEAAVAAARVTEQEHAAPIEQTDEGVVLTAEVKPAVGVADKENAPVTPTEGIKVATPGTAPVADREAMPEKSVAPKPQVEPAVAAQGMAAVETKSDERPRVRETGARRGAASIKIQDGEPATQVAPTAAPEVAVEGAKGPPEAPRVPLKLTTEAGGDERETQGVEPIAAERPAPASDSRTNAPPGEARVVTTEARGTSSPSGPSAAGVTVDAQRFVQRVAKAFAAAEQRGAPLRLRLSPPELGLVKLELVLRDGGVSARMEAENPAARQLLLDHLPQLRERLTEQNIRIERFEIDLMDRGLGQESRQPTDQASTPRPPAWQAKAGRPGDANQEPARNVAAPRSEPGRLNVIV